RRHRRLRVGDRRAGPPPDCSDRREHRLPPRQAIQARSPARDRGSPRARRRVVGTYAALEGDLDATGMRFAIVAARFNLEVTERLCAGAEKKLREHGAADVTVAWVPGAFELPLVAKRLAQSGT